MLPVASEVHAIHARQATKAAAAKPDNGGPSPFEDMLDSSATANGDQTADAQKKAAASVPVSDASNAAETAKAADGATTAMVAAPSQSRSQAARQNAAGPISAGFASRAASVGDPGTEALNAGDGTAPVPAETTSQSKSQAAPQNASQDATNAFTTAVTSAAAPQTDATPQTEGDAKGKTTKGKGETGDGTQLKKPDDAADAGTADASQAVQTPAGEQLAPAAVAIQTVAAGQSEPSPDKTEPQSVSHDTSPGRAVPLPATQGGAHLDPRGEQVKAADGKASGGVQAEPTVPAATTPPDVPPGARVAKQNGEPAKDAGGDLAAALVRTPLPGDKKVAETASIPDHASASKTKASAEPPNDASKPVPAPVKTMAIAANADPSKSGTPPADGKAANFPAVSDHATSDSGKAASPHHDASADASTTPVKTAADALQSPSLMQQVQTAPNLTAPAKTAATATPPTGIAVPLESVAVTIASSASSGKKSFDIRLDPPELGRIHVQLDVDHSGQISTHVIADRSDTLDLLRRDSTGLERALQDAGLKTSGNGLQFSLRDQGFGGNQQQQAAPLNMTTQRLMIQDETSDVLPSAYRANIGARSGIDIRV